MESLESLVVGKTYEAIFGVTGDIAISSLRSPNSGCEYICVMTQTNDSDQAFTLYKVPDVNPVVHQLVQIIGGYTTSHHVLEKSIYIPHLHTFRRPCNIVQIEMDDQGWYDWATLHGLNGPAMYDLPDISVVPKDTPLPHEPYFKEIVARF